MPVPAIRKEQTLPCMQIRRRSSSSGTPKIPGRKGITQSPIGRAFLIVFFPLRCGIRLRKIRLPPLSLVLCIHGVRCMHQVSELSLSKDLTGVNATPQKPSIRIPHLPPNPCPLQRQGLQKEIEPMCTTIRQNERIDCQQLVC